MIDSLSCSRTDILSNGQPSYLCRSYNRAALATVVMVRYKTQFLTKSRILIELSVGNCIMK